MTPLQALIVEKHKSGNTISEIEKSISDMGEDASMVRGCIENSEREQDQLRLKVEHEKELALRYYFSMQSFPNGLIAGIVAALMGAVLWCIIAVFTDRIFAILSIFIGFIVSFSVNKFGKGLRLEFKLMSMVLSLSGIFLGYCFIVLYIFSKYSNVSIWDMKSLLLNREFYKFVSSITDPMDVLFYIAAGVYAWIATKTTVSDQMVVDYISNKNIN